MINLPKNNSKKKAQVLPTPSQKLRFKLQELHNVRGSLLTFEEFYRYKIESYIDEVQKDIDAVTLIDRNY